MPVERFRVINFTRGEEMIANGDFERDADGDGMPDEWGNVEHWLPTTRAEVSQVALPGGNHALRVEFVTGGGCVINYLLRERNRYFRLGGTTYLSHSLRVKHHGHGVVHGLTIDANYSPVGTTLRLGRKGDWRTIGAVYRYDPAQNDGIVMIRIYIRAAKAGDVYWIDDYRLRAIEDSEEAKARAEFELEQSWLIISPEAAVKARNVKKGNLLRDSSFESNPEFCRIRDGMKWWADGGSLLKQSAFHGQYTIADRAVSDPYVYRDGKPHTLSFYVRGKAGSKAVVTISDTHVGSLSARMAFPVTPDWKRRRLSFQPTAPVEAPQTALKVTLSGAGCVFDAVQLEEGGLTDYRPPELELSVLLKRHADRSFVSFFYENESIPVLTSAQKRGPAEIEADLIVRDLWMKEVYRRGIKLRLPAGAHAAYESLAVPSLPLGAYRVHLEAGGSKSRSIQLGVISRKLSTGSEICGGSHETGMEYNRHVVKALGLTWSRHHAAYTGPYWGRKKDARWLSPDYWESEDRYMEEKRRNVGLRHWGSFVYPPEPWRTELKKLAGSDAPLPEGFFKNTEEYFHSAIPRFRRNIKYWECWNEPVIFTPEQYLRMLRRFNSMIKGLDPKAVVVGLSGFLDQGTWERYMVPLMELGALKHCDVISYHGYFDQWPEDKLWGYKNLRDYLDHIRSEAAKAGKPDMPIWDNEFSLWGTSWYDDERTQAEIRTKASRFDYRTGAAAIVHYVTIAYAHGVRHFGPHCFDHDVCQKQEGRIEYDQRAFDYDYSIRPKAISYAVVCHKLQGATLVKESIRGDVFTTVFAKPKGSLAIVFLRRGKAGSLSIPGDGLTFRNLFDGPATATRTARRTSLLRLTGEPVYIESDAPAEELAQTLEGIELR